MLIIQIALLKAGAVYAPLDHRHPPAKLQSAIDDQGIKTILCSSSTKESFALCSSATLIVLDDHVISAACSEFANNMPCSPVKPNNAAALLFTSGTTGMCTPREYLVNTDEPI